MALEKWRKPTQFDTGLISPAASSSGAGLKARLLHWQPPKLLTLISWDPSILYSHTQVEQQMRSVKHVARAAWGLPKARGPVWTHYCAAF
jgi:hypothetical protein